mmetsp:Transcript_111854/g.310880  ORF Transcript_111854/g.310880 Transcript_111854/m.310880 type:complete len:210 (-) Transcript_111854:101-730(-)
MWTRTTAGRGGGSPSSSISTPRRRAPAATPSSRWPSGAAAACGERRRRSCSGMLPRSSSAAACTTQGSPRIRSSARRCTRPARPCWRTRRRWPRPPHRSTRLCAGTPAASAWRRAPCKAVAWRSSRARRPPAAASIPGLGTGAPTSLCARLPRMSGSGRCRCFGRRLPRWRRAAASRPLRGRTRRCAHPAAGVCVSTSRSPKCAASRAR